MRVLLVLLVAMLLAAGCTPTATGMIFHTADPALSVLVPYAAAAVVTPDPVLAELEESEAEQTNCVIAGNIGANGEPIYHVPGGAYYNRVKIDLTHSNAAGIFEQWFCTVAAAEAAGFRKAVR